MTNKERHDEAVREISALKQSIAVLERRIPMDLQAIQKMEHAMRLATLRCDQAAAALGSV